MDTTRMRRRRSERGEGGGKFIVYLLFLAIGGYLAIQNVPTYFKMQNLKHDLAELARGAGAVNMSVEKVRKRADEIAQSYDVSPSDVKVDKNGRNLKISLSTTRTLNFIVTDYEWKIRQETTESAM